MKVLSSGLLRAATRSSPLTTRHASLARHVPAMHCASRIMPSTNVTTTRSLATQRVFFSDDSSSHDDFAPKRKTVADEHEAVKLIEEHVKANRIMLYMKGNPSMPMCGFSARVVQVLQTEGVDFASVNVLDYPAIREGVKKFSDWPTIPQLYIHGEFVGGCDIVTAMHESGELKDLLKEEEEEK